MTGTLTTLWAMTQEAAVEASAAAAPESLNETSRTDLEGGTYWMPPAATTNTDSVDWLFYGILGLTYFCFIGITIAVIYFTWRYRHRPGHRAQKSSNHNDSLEITWTVIPSIIVVFIFIWGWQGFVDLFTPPKHAMEVQVVASKWNFTFRYQCPDGSPSEYMAELHVPVSEPVRVVMRSEDVLHALFVPAFRVKNDIIPNRYTKLWFEATTPGVYRVTCAEYCGTQHSDMKTWVEVHDKGGYEQWLEETACKFEVDVAGGERAYKNFGCAQCHSLDGTTGQGPTFKGLFGSERPMVDGTVVTADENYIRESILDPNAKVVRGFNPIMPTFQGRVRDDHIDALIMFLRTLE